MSERETVQTKTDLKVAIYFGRFGSFLTPPLYTKKEMNSVMLLLDSFPGILLGESVALEFTNK